MLLESWLTDNLLSCYYSLACIAAVKCFSLYFRSVALTCIRIGAREGKGREGKEYFSLYSVILHCAPVRKNFEKANLSFFFFWDHLIYLLINLINHLHLSNNFFFLPYHILFQFILCLGRGQCSLCGAAR
jgi:hypothetical protein